MKKEIKEHLLAIFIYTIVFLLIYLILVRNSYLFGSTTDFNSQHYLLPEYFRNLFYETKDLLPDFALNLGGGQNILYFSYYGLLNPIILISYLFPKISMLNYIIISTSFLTVLSSVLMYFYLRKNKFNFISSLIGGLLLLLSSSLIFHTHRHIMFINYMPFLILGMMGIDNYFAKRKKLMLIFSIFIIIMMSYYYSIGCIISLIIYSIFKYLSIVKKFNIKQFIKDMLKLSIPYILGLMMGMIIILPTLYVILKSRGTNNSSVSLINLLIPNLSFKYILYSPYSPGCYFISLIALLYYSLKGKKEYKWLSVVILIFAIFPLFNYVLNGKLYIDPKSIIPLLPLIMLVTTKFIEQLLNKKIKDRYIQRIIVLTVLLSIIQFVYNYIFSDNSTGFILMLDTFSYSVLLTMGSIIFFLIYTIHKNTNKKGYLLAYLFILPFCLCIIVNSSDKLMNKESYIKSLDSSDVNLLKETINSDKSFYRINNQVNKSDFLNKIIDINQKHTSMYSSTINKNFDNLYYNEFKNNLIHRNRAMIEGSTNPLYNIFMGEKYIVSKNELIYRKIKEQDNIYLYENEYAFPIGYATSNIINIKDYEKLNYPSQQLSILRNAIVEHELTNSEIEEVEKINLDYGIKSYKNLLINKIENGYEINSNNGSLKIELNEKYKNGILFIKIKNELNTTCAHDDLFITINNVKNKLTCKNWKYYNNNLIFYYTLTNTNMLDIKINKGKYRLTDFEFYYLSNEEIKDLHKEKDSFVVEESKGDKIVGNINVEKSGYFVMQIPYDKGFEIMVDNKKTEYENVNGGVLGFKIQEGYHNISIEFKSPYKKEGIIIALLGFVLTLIMLIIDSKKKVLKLKNE